jgi:hypothetical protein
MPMKCYYLRHETVNSFESRLQAAALSPNSSRLKAGQNFFPFFCGGGNE